MIRRLIRYVGRRGAALLVFAFIDIAIGVSFLDPETSAQTRAIPTYRATLEVASLTVWAWLWLLVAATCAVGAFRQKDRLSFGAAIAIKVVWAGSFLASWILYSAPRAWLAAATWGVLAALVLLISGWPEPNKRGRSG